MQTMTLQIQAELDATHIKALTNFLHSLDPKATITQEQCPICKAHDYTLSPSAEKRILGAVKEIENERKNGTLKTYTSIDELREALEA